MVCNQKEGFIYLRNVRLHAFHGVMEQERVTGNDYVLNIKVGYPIGKAMSSDLVEDTLNYAELFSVVKEEMKIPSNLLEHVARRIANQLFETFPRILSVDIDICKSNPPVGGDMDGAGVEVHFVNAGKEYNSC